MDWRLIAVVAVMVALISVPALISFALREIVMWDRRRFPSGLKIIRVAFWLGATGLYAGLAALLLSQDLGGEFLGWASVFYFIAAGSGYRLVLRLAYLATATDAYEKEVRESDGLTELGLTDQSRR